MKYRIIATTVFGLEAVVKNECEKLGFSDIEVKNGRVEFTGDQRDIAKANLWLRTAERVFIELGSFKAFSFEELYQGIKGIPWEEYLDDKGQYIVLSNSVKSKLYSKRDIQSISKKALIDRLSKEYDQEWFSEDGARYRIEVSILEDRVSVSLDTSGIGLHKRGYRQAQTEAPMKETLASALVQLSYWTPDRPLVDIFCGSGTIAIEAAMLAKNIAPGIDRDFDFKYWKFYDEKIFQEERIKALNSVYNDLELDIMGFDIDKKAVNIAKENAYNAGVDEDIQFIRKDVKYVGLQNNFGVLISNPPYGERIGDDREIRKIYKKLSEYLSQLSTWSFYIITSDKDFEESVNRWADRKRKLYNGRIEVDLYQYYGPDPSLLK